jgi:hypothetical protein
MKLDGVGNDGVKCGVIEEDVQCCSENSSTNNMPIIGDKIDKTDCGVEDVIKKDNATSDQKANGT